MAQPPVIVKLSRLDPPDNLHSSKHVLVHVSSSGKRPLDLNLIGTEGSSIYSVSCKVATGSPGSTLGLDVHALIRG